MATEEAQLSDHAGEKEDTPVVAPDKRMTNGGHLDPMQGVAGAHECAPDRETIECVRPDVLPGRMAYTGNQTLWVRAYARKYVSGTHAPRSIHQRTNIAELSWSKTAVYTCQLAPRVLRVSSG